MKTALVRFVVIAVLAVALGSAWGTPAPVFSQDPVVATLSCVISNGNWAIRANVSATYQTVTVNAQPLNGAPFTTVTAYIGFPTPGNFLFANANGTYRIRITDTSGGGNILVFDQQKTCPEPEPEPVSEPEPEPVSEPEPGCDIGLPLTADAAVGQVTVTTPLYYAPDELISPTMTLEAGKTLWVLGLNEAGTFYKAYLACSAIWLPVDSLGPNYDATWEGTPLPTGVVE